MTRYSLDHGYQCFNSSILQESVMLTRLDNLFGFPRVLSFALCSIPSHLPSWSGRDLLFKLYHPVSNLRFSLLSLLGLVKHISRLSVAPHLLWAMFGNLLGIFLRFRSGVIMSWESQTQHSSFGESSPIENK